MSRYYSYKVFPRQVHIPSISKGKGFNQDKLIFILITFIIGIISFATGVGIGITLGILAIVTIIITVSQMLEDIKKEKELILKGESEVAFAEKQQKLENMEAESYSKKLNELLTKSDQIINEILPSYEQLTKRSIGIAKIDFDENAFSPFWSNIEDAKDTLAYFKEAVMQLCLNSELYARTLKNLSHNFPLPFPFATKISITETIDEYKTIVRKAHTNPTFAIIWEQRRNSQILAGGFNNLESAISNMSNEIYSAITDLKYSVKASSNELKYLQIQQVETIRECEKTLNRTLTDMDNKLYYIQWKKKPLEKFRHR